jgi:anti-sigma regulatory factor (Ser/Thr protein kinase)
MHLSLVAEPHAVAAARRACVELAIELPGTLSSRLELLISELVTNAVRHGSERPTDVISLEVRASPTSLRARVSDSGPGFDRPEAPRKGSLSPGGWGLVLVDSISDRWGVSRRPPHVWFELDLLP